MPEKTNTNYKDLQIIWFITFLSIFLIIPIIAQKIYPFLNDSSTHIIYQSDVDMLFLCSVALISLFATIKSFRKINNNFLASFIPVVVLFLMLVSGLIYHFFVPAKTWENGGCHNSSMCADDVTQIIPFITVLIVLNLILILIGSIFFRLKNKENWMANINRRNFLYFSSIPLAFFLLALFKETISKIIN
ncbi:MAG: hypothetical protein KBB86_02355 [Candidatus Pacebacteria bacterium]|nr:hypothetical protein [Candidatus Paceibacterota bacterium]